MGGRQRGREAEQRIREAEWEAGRWGRKRWTEAEDKGGGGRGSQRGREAEGEECRAGRGQRSGGQRGWETEWQ